MEATLSTRPRLEPGIPAGGIAALAVVAVTFIGGMIGGPGDQRSDRVAVVGNFASHPGHPIPPIPPIPAIPAIPPIPPMPEVHVDAEAIAEAVRASQVDAEAIRRSVEEAVRDADWGAVRAAAEAARAEAARIRAEARAVPQARPESGSNGTLSASFIAPQGIELVDLRGDVNIRAVEGQEEITLTIEDGSNAVRTAVQDGRLMLVGAGGRNVTATLRVPADAPLTLAGFVGDLVVEGRYDGAVTLELRRGDVQISSASRVTATVLERGDINLGRIAGPVSFSTTGSADLTLDRAESLAGEITGSGDINVGRLENGMNLSIPGTIGLSVDRVEGPVKVDFMGAGDIVMAAGDISTLDLVVTGVGNVTYEGRAQDVRAFAAGRGSISIPRGGENSAQVQNEGTGTVQVGG